MSATNHDVGLGIGTGTSDVSLYSNGLATTCSGGAGASALAVNSDGHYCVVSGTTTASG